MKFLRALIALPATISVVAGSVFQRYHIDQPYERTQDIVRLQISYNV